MKTSQRGIDLIKNFEGCKLTAYKDAVGVWTIGYGHTKGVKQGQKITQEQAEKYLADDLSSYEKKVEKYNDKYNFNQNQFDALVSFCYNIGNIDQLTAKGTRTIKKISDCILLYNKASGKVLAGLTKRRKAEKELFDEPVEAVLNEKEPEVVNNTPKEEKAQETAPSVVKTPYTKGQTYTIKVKSALNVRKGAGKQFGVVGYNNLSADAKKHSNGGSALLNGTRITVQDVKVISDNEVWVKIPSGWICAIDGSKTFVV